MLDRNTKPTHHTIFLKYSSMFILCPEFLIGIPRDSIRHMHFDGFWGGSDVHPG